MSLHVSFNPLARLPSLTEMRELIQRKPPAGWLGAVLQWDRVSNNYYDKSKEELEWIDSVREMLEKELIPDQYRTGIHLLHKQASFMGEDIFIYKGHLVTTLHAGHKDCKKYQVLNWDALYCVPCQKHIESDDLYHG